MFFVCMFYFDFGFCGRHYNVLLSEFSQPVIMLLCIAKGTSHMLLNVLPGRNYPGLSSGLNEITGILIKGRQKG